MSFVFFHAPAQYMLDGIGYIACFVAKLLYLKAKPHEAKSKGE